MEFVHNFKMEITRHMFLFNDDITFPGFFITAGKTIGFHVDKLCA